jgi:hypothetical protein
MDRVLARATSTRRCRRQSSSVERPGGLGESELRAQDSGSLVQGRPNGLAALVEFCTTV